MISQLMDNVYVGFALIFCLRVIDVALGTLRVVYILQARKYRATIIGFVEVTIFIFAVSQVVANLDNWILMFAYSGGFATGTLVGLLLEERLAVGFAQVRVISRDRGGDIALKLWEEGFGATVVDGTGKQGAVELIFCIAPRRFVHKIEAIATGLDSDCFIAVSDSRSLLRGFAGPVKKK
ncbi:MAG: DUF2179 domain-containing protein [bacterium]|jgi:uncharacterized protein YebE (UPF0316 family)